MSSCPSCLPQLSPANCPALAPPQATARTPPPVPCILTRSPLTLLSSPSVGVAVFCAVRVCMHES